MAETLAILEASIQQKIDADMAFQSELESLSDEEKDQKISERKGLELEQELSGLKEKADKVAKAEELANNYKIRAEKAEKAIKGEGEPPKNSPEKSLSTKDTLALIEAKVATDDFDEVVEYATYRKISVAEALKTSTLKTILAERAEQRQTANATQTKSPRGTSKDTGEGLLEKAQQGQVSDKDEDIEKLAEARMAARLARK